LPKLLKYYIIDSSHYFAPHKVKKIMPTLKEYPDITSPSPSAEIKLLVFDLDGTIVGASNTISESVKQTIKAVKAKGIRVAIATGRMYRSALRFHQAIESDLPLMCYQGAWIQDPVTEKIIRHFSVPKQIVMELLDYLEQPELRETLSVHFYINDELYVRDINQDTKHYISRSKIPVTAVGDLRKLLTQEPTKVLALCDNPQVITDLLMDLSSRYTPEQVYMTKSVPTFFEATNPLANKGEAVRYLAEEILDLKAHNVMTIGDNFNDWEMLTYAGIGVAMGDAPDEVKEIANWVAPGVEEDGAVSAIRKFLL
jgi:Cof subfamily protein (haloacid dehalogenase superfamily)